MKRWIALLLSVLLLIFAGVAGAEEMTDAERAEKDIRAELDDNPKLYWETPLGAHDLRRVANNADKLAEMLEKLAGYAEERESVRYDATKSTEDFAAADKKYEERLKEVKDSYESLLTDDLDDISVPYVDPNGKTIYIEIEDKYEMLFDIKNYNPTSADKKGFAGEGGNSVFLKILAEQARALKPTAARKAAEAELDCAYRLSEKTKMDWNTLVIGIAKLRENETKVTAETELVNAKQAALNAKAAAQVLIQDTLQVSLNMAQREVLNAQAALYNEAITAYAEAVTATWNAVTVSFPSLPTF